MEVKGSLLRQLVSFSMAGVAGLIVDTSVLYAGLAAGLGLHAARIPSYLSAVTTTWALNRRYTFNTAGRRASMAEWGKFAFTQLGGAAVNLGAYSALVQFSTVVAKFPAIGVAAGSLSGMSVNYLVARIYVFREGKTAAACEASSS